MAIQLRRISPYFVWLGEQSMFCAWAIRLSSSFLLRIGIAFPINICVSCLPVSRTLLDVPTFPTTIFSLVNILASFGHRKTLLSLILADGYYDGFKSRHRNEYTDSGASDLLLPK